MRVLRSVGDEIRIRRQRAGLTQAELGEAAGLDGGHLSYVERDLKHLSVKSLHRVAHALHVELHAKYGESVDIDDISEQVDVAPVRRARTPRPAAPEGVGPHGGANGAA